MKFLIADDHALFRDGLSMLLEQLDPAAVIMQASNFAQTLKILDVENDFDLIIIDLSMQDMQWKSGFSALKEKSGRAGIVVISASEDISNIRGVLGKGAKGYISKCLETKTLSNALKLILDGGTYIPPIMLRKNVEGKDALPLKNKGRNLTKRQIEVLTLIARGMSNKQIAFEIGISEATVKLHINALLRSMGVINRTQAVITAQKMGII